MSTFTPTAEQDAIVEQYRSGGDLVVEAGAGTGKSSTLRLLGQAEPARRALYLAFNKTIATDAARTFPTNVTCRTVHSLAFQAVAKPYAHRLKAPRLRAADLATILADLNPKAFKLGLGALHRSGLARLASATVTRFQQSADPEPVAGHVPDVPGLRPDEQQIAVAAAVMLAKSMWTDLNEQHGKCRYTHDCQPPGTLVRRVIRRGGNSGSTFEDVPIETIVEGDRVVSYTSTLRRGYVRRDGRPVTAVGYRDYSGTLTTVTTTRGRSSSYTAEHRCIVRLDCDLADGNHVVYLARRGTDYRVGRTTWRTTSQNNTLGIRRRAESQRADAMWILSVHGTDADAALEEALVAHQWRLPTWQFTSVNETMPLHRFWSKVGNNAADARACLSAHQLQVDHPFWERGAGWETTRRPVIMRALNLLPGMLVLEADEIIPSRRGELRAHHGTNGWAPAQVTRSPYDGPVYNLDVADDHTYIADGIATHNCYLKQWALTAPRLHVDAVMLDEAQDTNPVLADLVDRQAHAQRIPVGDQCQAIYGWRGATDAMAGWDWTRLQLSQSFRFGPQLAEHANLWLDLLDATLRLTGNGPYDTGIGYVAEPDAILTRGNVGALVAANRERDNGRRAAIVGGTKEIKQLAFAARDLQDGRPTDHPELLGFDDWTVVQEYCEEDADGSDLATFVRLIDRFGHRWVLAVADDFATEQGAEVVVSTAHKAKGREWPRVQIAGDFPQPGDTKPDGTPVDITREDAMLAYVAVTRAREHLDPGGLAWIEYARPELAAPTAVAA